MSLKILDYFLKINHLISVDQEIIIITRLWIRQSYLLENILLNQNREQMEVRSI